MKLKVFSIYDSKAEAFNKPFFMSTTGQAIRAFSDVVNSSDDVIAKHPGDYTLFEIAEYDDQTGAFACLPTPVSLGLAITYVASEGK